MASLFQFSVRSLLVAVTIAAVGIAALLNANGWWEAAIWSLALLSLAIGLLLIIYRQNERRAFWVGYLVFGGLFVAALLCSFSINVVDQGTFNATSLYYSLPTTRLTQLVYESVLPESRRLEQIPAPASAPTATAESVGLNAYPINDLLIAPGGAAADPAAMTGPSSPLVSGDMAGGPAPYAATGTTGPVALSYSVTFHSAGPPTIANPSYIPPGNFISIGQALWLLLIAAAGGKVCQLIYRTRPRERSATVE